MVHLRNQQRLRQRNEITGIIIVGSRFMIIIDRMSKGHLGASKQFQKPPKKQMHHEIVGQVFETRETYPIIKKKSEEQRRCWKKKGQHSSHLSHGHLSCNTRCHVDRATDTPLEEFPPDSPFSLVSSQAHTPYAIPQNAPWH